MSDRTVTVRLTEETDAPMPYVATINVPGYLPMDDEPPTFERACDAWDYLASERLIAEEDFACDETCDDGPACQWGYTHDASDTHDMLSQRAIEARNDGPEATGSVIGDTPGYHGDHDLGLAYSVSFTETDD